MKVLVTGGSGMLGRQVVQELRRRKIHYVAPTHSQMDVTDPDSVARTFKAETPDIVIHCAAWTQVDLAESRPAECMAVNASGTQHIATACRIVGASMLYVSTDYVFGDGEPGKPHEPADMPEPTNVYGLSKLQGEVAVRSLLTRYFIVRASWLYDPECRGFVQTIISAAEEGHKLRVVNDQTGAPTWVRDLAPALVDLALSNRYGLHAVVPEGSCTWYDFARAILRHKGLRNHVEAISSQDWGAPAQRPACSLLTPTVQLRSWQSALAEALSQEKA